MMMQETEKPHPLYIGTITLEELKQLKQLGLAPPRPTKWTATLMLDYFRDHRFPIPAKVKEQFLQLRTTAMSLPTALVELVVDGYFDDGEVQIYCRDSSYTDYTKHFVYGLQPPKQLPGSEEAEHIAHGLTTISGAINQETFYIFGTEWYRVDTNDPLPRFTCTTSSTSYYVCSYNKDQSKLTVCWYETANANTLNNANTSKSSNAADKSSDEPILIAKVVLSSQLLPAKNNSVSSPRSGSGRCVISWSADLTQIEKTNKLFLSKLSLSLSISFYPDSAKRRRRSLESFQVPNIFPRKSSEVWKLFVMLCSWNCLELFIFLDRYFVPDKVCKLKTSAKRKPLLEWRLASGVSRNFSWRVQRKLWIA